MLIYLVLGLAGVAVALFGAMNDELNWLVFVGVAMILAGFFWFVRARQGTPIMTKEDGAQP